MSSSEEEDDRSRNRRHGERHGRRRKRDERERHDRKRDETSTRKIVGSRSSRRERSAERVRSHDHRHHKRHDAKRKKDGDQREHGHYSDENDDASPIRRRHKSHKASNYQELHKSRNHDQANGKEDDLDREKRLEKDNASEKAPDKQTSDHNKGIESEKPKKSLESWLKKKKMMKEMIEKSRTEASTNGQDKVNSLERKEKEPVSIDEDKNEQYKAIASETKQEQDTKKEWNLDDDEEDGVPMQDTEELVDSVGQLHLPRLGELGGQSAAIDDDDGFEKFTFNSKNSTKHDQNTKASNGRKNGKEELSAMEVFRKEQATDDTGAKGAENDVEIDPLDAFMVDNVMPEVEKLKQKDMVLATMPQNEEAHDKSNDKDGGKPRDNVLSIGPLDDSSLDEEASSVEEDDVEWARKVQTGRLSKADKLGITDHSKIDYPPFRRNFYVEVPELARMTKNEVEAYRKELDGLKVRGKNVPKPLKQWTQAGLNARVMDVLRRSSFDRPLPIQAQSLPVIMSGRDCIGIAKTGSGKTLAFVLPMIRHIKDQKPLGTGDGPIALIMAPTRELVSQIHREVKRFTRPSGLRCTAVFGGSGVANQISELKRGSEVVVCTPGRMIDVLATGNGRITNLHRVTYLVLDEADRMFDMGFEPQVSNNNCRFMSHF